MKTCKDIEREYGKAKCKCAQYRKHFPKGECASQSVSKWSPGPVTAEETLIRFVVPSQVKDSDLAPGSFVGTAKGGVSVIRQGHVTRRKLDQIKQEFAEVRKVAVADIRVAVAECRHICDINHEGMEAFHIYDSALETNKAHADICRSACVEAGASDRKGTIKKLVRKLVDCFEFVDQDKLALADDGTRQPSGDRGAGA